MAKEYAAYLKGKMDVASEMLSRPNSALTEEWKAYRHLLRIDEITRERLRRAATADDEAAFLRRFAIC